MNADQIRIPPRKAAAHYLTNIGA